MDFDIHQLDGRVPDSDGAEAAFGAFQRRCWNSSHNRRRAKSVSRPIRIWASGQPS